VVIPVGFAMLAGGIALEDSALQRRLAATLEPAELRGVLVGAAAMDASGQLLFGRNADERMIPASNQKVLTGAYSLARLGADRRIQTRFWKIPGGVIIDAPGDPTITRDDLLRAKEALKLEKGGDVLIRAAFDPGAPPSWEWDDLPWYYAPVITAFTYDRSAFEAKTSGGRLDPIPSELDIRIVRTRTSGSRKIDFNRWTRELSVQGALPTEEASLGRLAMPDPSGAAARLLGGRAGVFRDEPPSREPDFVLTSVPVAKIVQDCLEPSDNMAAEHLLLMAAASEGALSPGQEYAQAAGRMRAFFVAEGMGAEDDLRPIDGSGLSRHNLVTPSVILRAHRWAEGRFGPVWEKCLAAPGEGTLGTRLKGTVFAGKTGTINAVSTLSGLLSAARPGSPRYVCVFLNNALAPARVLRQVQDAFIVECAKHEAGLDGEAVSNPIHSAHHADARARASASDRVR
jgi:D-alanyl-D-alanine carboxypeptidase/D-alanyl-D-alanine-endopeptidase (penicillin-binding protein 4)